MGKTTIAQMLADKLDRPLISTDLEIEKKLGQSIFDYIQKGGTWESFRAIESQVINDCVTLENAVIDCGGGVVETHSNIETLKSSGKVFWLTADVSTILERMDSSGKRPNLTKKSSKEEVVEVLKQRTPLYQKTCHEQVSTDGDNFLNICEKILNLFYNVDD